MSTVVAEQPPRTTPVEPDVAPAADAESVDRPTWRPELVSIILATYNERENICHTIAEIFKHVRTPVEVIVVDDDSPDETWKLVARMNDERVKLIRRVSTRGLASAFNRGIIESRGDVVGWMDADTCMPPHLLPTMIDGNLMIIPLENWTGTETVWVVAVDDEKKEAKVRLDVTVTPINDAPVVKATLPASMDITANEGQVVEIEVKLVEDVDTNVTDLQYMWYVDDVMVEGSGALLNLETDFDPDTSTVSAGTYTVKVEVSDGALYDTVEWNLTILNVNQGPENIVILSPKDGDKFKHNQVIELRADNATDIDGDTLTYTWKDNATGEVLGKNQTLEIKKLKKGTHVIILEVTDGQGGSNTTTVEFTVKAKPAAEPGFEAVVFMAAVVIAVLMIRTGRRRR